MGENAGVCGRHFAGAANQMGRGRYLDLSGAKDLSEDSLPVCKINGFRQFNTRPKNAKPEAAVKSRRSIEIKEISFPPEHGTSDSGLRDQNAVCIQVSLKAAT